MSPALKPLWREYYEDRFRPAPEKVRRSCHCYLEHVTQTFGIEFTDALTRSMDDGHVAELENAFEEGFAAAFRLWAEVVRDEGRHGKQDDHGSWPPLSSKQTT